LNVQLLEDIDLNENISNNKKQTDLMTPERLEILKTSVSHGGHINDVL